MTLGLPYRVIVACFPICAAALPASGQVDPHYYYFKQRRELEIDTARIAVESAEGLDPDLVRPIVEWYGATLVDITPLGIPGWEFVEIESATADSVRLILDDLAVQPFVSFISHVYLTDRAGWVVPTRNVLLQTLAAIRPSELSGQNRNGLNWASWNHVQNGYMVQTALTTGHSILDVANELALEPDIRFAEPSMLHSGGAAMIPNDPGFANCWGIHNTGQFEGVADIDMDGPEAWETTISHPGVVVVVIDCGVQQDHPDIHQISGMDFTFEQGGGGPVNQFDRHGTAVAGTITATINNATGTVGIAPGSMTASARTFIAINEDGEWVSKGEWTVEALSWAQTIGARITNNSNFYGFESSAIAQKYAETRGQGMVHFASAGNSALAALEYPASLPDVVSVGAVNNQGNRAFFSNFGPDLDLVAPGTTIYTTDQTGPGGYALGSYAFLDGTSFSSSYAAGVGALFIATHPDTTAATIEEGLKFSTRDLGDPGRDDQFGWGMVNAAGAVMWDPQCTSTPAPQMEAFAVPKNRYVSIRPQTGDRLAAINVKAIALPEHWLPMLGVDFWVGEPFDQPVPGSSIPLRVARLECDPVFRRWDDGETIHVVSPAIIPAATYRVEAVYESCFQPTSWIASESLDIPTPRWGDVIEPFSPPSPSIQPDFMDIASIVDRFRGNPNAPDLTRADLVPELLNFGVDFSDVSAAVDAFRGGAYPYGVTCLCQSQCP